jgi:hypothetical protein
MTETPRTRPSLRWTVIGVYVLYLLPYIGASYYDRYALPLIGVKVLLVIWAVDRLVIWTADRLQSFCRGERHARTQPLPLAPSAGL